MAKPTTSGFTISGLLDRSASTRNDYPVERIPIEEIADHPANAAYSMDEAGIAQLAKSIEEEFGLRPVGGGRLAVAPGAEKAPKLAAAIKAWESQVDALDRGEITPEEYESWKMGIGGC